MRWRSRILLALSIALVALAGRATFADRGSPESDEPSPPSRSDDRDLPGRILEPPPRASRGAVGGPAERALEAAAPDHLRIEVTADGFSLSGRRVDTAGLLAGLRDVDLPIVVAGAASIPWERFRRPLLCCVHPDVRNGRISLLVTDTGERVRIDVPPERLVERVADRWEAEVEITVALVTDGPGEPYVPFGMVVRHLALLRSTGVSQVRLTGLPPRWWVPVLLEWGEDAPTVEELVAARVPKLRWVGCTDAWGWEDLTAVGDLLDLGDAALPCLDRALADPSTENRADVLRFLGQRGGDCVPARDAVLRTMNDRDEALARDAARIVAGWPEWRDGRSGGMAGVAGWPEWRDGRSGGNVRLPS